MLGNAKALAVCQNIVALGIIFDDAGYPEAQASQANGYIQAISQAAGAAYVDVSSWICGTCNRQSDNQHLDPAGEILFASYLKPITASYLGSSQTVLVPNVTGMTQASANSAIMGTGLALGNISQASSTIVASGSVVSQSPAPGTSATVGSTVALVISTGPPAQTGTVSCTGGNVNLAIPGTTNITLTCSVTIN
jgi:hypothetical protein